MGSLEVTSTDAAGHGAFSRRTYRSGDGNRRAADEAQSEKRAKMNLSDGLANRSEEARGQLDGFGPGVQYRVTAEKFIERTQKVSSANRRGTS